MNLLSCIYTKLEWNIKLQYNYWLFDQLESKEKVYVEFLCGVFTLKCTVL